MYGLLVVYSRMMYSGVVYTSVCRVVRSGGSCSSLSVKKLLEACALCHYFRSVLKKRRG